MRDVVDSELKEQARFDELKQGILGIEALDHAERRLVEDNWERIKDLIELSFVPGTPAYRNVGEAEIYGIEFEAAYVGENMDLGGGRVILEPRTLAKMLDSLDISGGELVLDIGAAFGYSSAVIARMAQAVVAVEENADMVAEAQTILSEQGADNVILHEGPLAAGAPEHGPYDVIVVQGAVEQIPDDLLEQLKDGGRIACVFSDNALGVVRVGYKIDGDISWRYAFNAGAPVLPGFVSEAEFAL